MAESDKNISGIERAAAVIVSLGADKAANVFKFLKEDEIEQLSYEVARLRRFESEELQGILEDFYRMCLTQKFIAEGGVDYAKDILEKAFGSQQAAAYMERISKSLKSKAFEFVRKADYKTLMTILQSEHPQTIALVLSYARADQASLVLSEIPKEKRIDVVERIAKLDRAHPDVIKIVENVLEHKLSSIISLDFMEIGGINYVADIMNLVDRSTEKFIFDELINRDPILAEDIRKLMFVFEDIVELDSVSIQRFLREVDNKDLAVALKSSNNPEVKNVILQNMTARMRETIEADIQYLSNIRMKDVEEAQQRIVAAIRSLEEAGEIVISKGGKDDLIV